ncbi:hypothetical protein [[Scytonema hofmanni] UTEX B 1581]|uniref:hypothetical protein n=1 Tax=[Scytonema hofmanni] UTEX B 1581 TaxID=379535 RepID=UPI0004B2D64B|nr:hypothetical protein [[Scytonema hofmanni] UTEX B 1581]
MLTINGDWGQGDKGTRGQGDKGTRGQGDKENNPSFPPSPPLPISPSPLPPCAAIRSGISSLTNDDER